MLAILLTALFWAIALLAMASTIVTVRNAIPAIRNLRAELRACETVNQVRYEWRQAQVRATRPARAGFRPSARPQARVSLPAAA